MDNGIKTKERFEIIDVLRGLAIAAILIIHSSNHFIYNSFPQDSPQWLQNLDSWSQRVIYFLIEGKAYAIFATLFGVSYALMLENQKARGRDFSYRMAWRMLLLVIFGVINAAFFAGGDPLVYYAICMLAIIPLRNASNRTLAIIAAIMLLQPLEIIDSIYPFIGNMNGRYYGEVSKYVARGEFFPMVIANITIGLKACMYWAVECGRFTQTLGLFLIGIIIYRKRWLMPKEDVVRRYLLGSMVLTVIFAILDPIVANTWWRMLYNLMFATFWITLIVYLHQRRGDRAIWRNFAKLGQMSLTNFIGQSVICSFIFYPWGLNLSPKLGVTLSILTALLVLVLQIAFSRLWLKNHKRGPLEYIWHRLTWLK